MLRVGAMKMTSSLIICTVMLAYFSTMKTGAVNSSPTQGRAMGTLHLGAKFYEAPADWKVVRFLLSQDISEMRESGFLFPSRSPYIHNDFCVIVMLRRGPVTTSFSGSTLCLLILNRFCHSVSLTVPESFLSVYEMTASFLYCSISYSVRLQLTYSCYSNGYCWL